MTRDCPDAGTCSRQGGPCQCAEEEARRARDDSPRPVTHIGDMGDDDYCAEIARIYCTESAEAAIMAMLRESRFVTYHFPPYSSGAGDMIEHWLAGLRREWAADVIPVRVPSGARPVLTSDRTLTVAADHPMAAVLCPVCGEAVAGRKTVLILAGIAPDHQREAGATTGAAVMVHSACTGYGEDEDGQAAER